MKNANTCVYLAFLPCLALGACSGDGPSHELDAATLGDSEAPAEPDSETSEDLDPMDDADTGPIGDTDTDEPSETGETGDAGGPAGSSSDGADVGDTGEPGDTGDTGVDPALAPDDGDHAASPGVLAQFRNTAGAPVSVEGPLLDLDEPIDTRGLQYIQTVSNPGDAEDWVAFSIVPGENDPVIDVELHCTGSELDPQPLRADLLDGDGDVIETIVCGQGPSSIVLDQASSLDQYAVVVYALEGVEHFAEYTLEIDAFCFQSCTFQPYQP